MPRVGKRRRNLLDSSSPPSKRQRVEEYNPEQQWEALAIVSEETAKYLVKWTDIDPATGELYEPTWEKKEDVGPGLIEGWERRHKSVHRPRQNVLLSSDSVEEIQESEQSLLEQTQEEVAFNVPQVIPAAIHHITIRQILHDWQFPIAVFTKCTRPYGYPDYHDIQIASRSRLSHWVGGTTDA